VVIDMGHILSCPVLPGESTSAATRNVDYIPPVQTSPASPFERFGGHEFFDLLINRFYAGVAEDPVLRPMYPEADLAPAAERLRMFLEQYWGGPTTYSQQRGHPRLRMRHAAFPVDVAAHDAWLRHMRDALDEAAPAVGMSAGDAAELWEYLTRAAHSMVNTYPGRR
jgi:hemoglobin